MCVCRTAAGRRAAGYRKISDAGPNEVWLGAGSEQAGRRGANEGAKCAVSTVRFRQEYSGRDACNASRRERGVKIGFSVETQGEPTAADSAVR
jgi:hypothetical protein